MGEKNGENGASVPATRDEAQVAPTGPPKTIEELLTGEYYRNAIAKAAPRHLDADRFIRICNTAVMKTPKLRNCTPMSFWNCMIQLSSLGLEPNGREAHLIPYGREATLIVDYKGLVECINRSGDVSYIKAELVCDNDDFEYDRGQVTRHRIDFKNPRGDHYAVYSHARLKDGNDVYEVLTREDVEKVREMSPSWKFAERGDNSKGGGKKDSTWHQWEGQMWKKTAIRRHSNTLPFSSEVRRIIEADDRHLYPEIDRRTITESDIRSMANGSRMKIRKPEPEPVEAETEPAPEPGAREEAPPEPETQAEPTVEDMRKALKAMPKAEFKKLCLKAGLDSKNPDCMALEDNVRTLYEAGNA